MANKKFPSECNPRGVVKPLDKVLIYNSDTGASDEFSTVGQLTKIQDDAINALNDTKVDTVEGKSLILDTEIARLANVTNQTLDGLGGEATANKKSTINESDTEFPTSKAVFDGLGLKVDKTSVKGVSGASETDVVSQKFVTNSFTNTEEAAASVLNALNRRIEALEKVITQGTLTQSQIGTLDVQALKYQGSLMTLSGAAVPAVIPDFIGQRYVQLGVKVWTAVGNSSVADWK